MSDTPTPLGDRVEQLVHPYRGEERTCAVRILAAEVRKVEAEANEADTLRVENMCLRQAVERLRGALRGMIDAVEGGRMQSALQRAKDLL